MAKIENLLAKASEWVERLSNFIAGARKMVVALGNALIVTGAAIQDSVVTSEEWFAIGAAWTAVVAVYQIPNKVGAVNRKR